MEKDDMKKLYIISPIILIISLFFILMSAISCQGAQTSPALEASKPTNTKIETTTESETTKKTQPPATKNLETTKKTSNSIDAISWNNAKSYIGQRITVYGPVVSTAYASGSKGQPTFLNMGKAYPDQGRVAIVIWGSNRSNFPQSPEKYYSNKNIYVTGLVTEYQGVPQIEITHPSQISE